MIKIDDLRRANAGLGYITIRIKGNSLNIRCRMAGMSFDKCPFPATPEGLKATVALCKQIEADIYRQQYDPTMKRYGLGKKENPAPPVEAEVEKEYTIRDAWNDYKRVKSHSIAQSTKRAKWSWVDTAISCAPSELLAIPRAMDLLQFLRSKWSDGTILNVVSTLQAAVNLAIDAEKYHGKNPYQKLKKIFQSDRKVIKSFTTEEVRTILDAFNNTDRGKGGAYYSPSYFYNFVKFRFLTGCRPSEALALEWDDITVDAKGKYKVSINKRYTSGQLLKGTKNGVRERVLPCSDSLIRLLQSIPRNGNKLVFPSFTGSYINLGTFTKDYWKPIVERLHSEGKISCYLPFYDIRHTFGTHALRSGIDVKTLSTYMGNSPEVLLSHYVQPDENVVTPDYDL